MEEFTYKIRGCIVEVFKELGPGLLESIYEAALIHELGWMDILVGNEVIVEVKSIEGVHDVHKKQLLTYLKLTGRKIGILVNFNSAHLVDKESLIRIVNNY